MDWSNAQAKPYYVQCPMYFVPTLSIVCPLSENSDKAIVHSYLNKENKM